MSIIKIKRITDDQVFDLELSNKEFISSEQRSMGSEEQYDFDVDTITPKCKDNIKIVSIYIYPMNSINIILLYNEDMLPINTYEVVEADYYERFGK